MKRINSMTELSDDEVFKCIDSLKNYFKIPSDTIVSKNFSKTDAMSTMELYTFGDCINKVAALEPV